MITSYTVRADAVFKGYFVRLTNMGVVLPPTGTSVRLAQEPRGPVPTQKSGLSGTWLVSSAELLGITLFTPPWG